jgi:hypothetical protein|nr:MAG TPA: hypothetical protein [Caudoviricetes sp.]
MKKQKVQHKRTGVKLSRTNRSKLRRSKKTEVVFRSPGPSPFITKGEDGKVSITNIVGKVSQKSYTTDIGKNARQENKTAKQAKKDRIKQILASAGFDPTIKYTRKEKKKFTRTVKKNLFAKKEVVIPSEEEVNKRKFKYVIQRKRSEKIVPAVVQTIEDHRVYDFKTDYFEATSKEDAFKLAVKEAKKFEKDSSFTGVTVYDMEGDNSITYYTRSKLLAA